MNDITREALDNRIVNAFSHLYPYIGPDYFTVHHDDDREVITVRCSNDDVPPFRAQILSDDDGYVRFTVFDEDDEPADDDHDYISIRIRYEDCAGEELHHG